MGFSNPQSVFPQSLSWVSPIPNLISHMFLYVPPISNWGFPLPQSLTWVHHYPIPNPGSPTSYFSLCYPNPQPMCVPSPNMGSSGPRSHMKSSETGILNVVIDKNHACSRYLRVNSGEKSPGSFIFPRVLFSTHSTHFWKVRIKVPQFPYCHYVSVYVCMHSRYSQHRLS